MGKRQGGLRKSALRSSAAVLQGKLKRSGQARIQLRGPKAKAVEDGPKLKERKTSGREAPRRSLTTVGAPRRRPPKNPQAKAKRKRPHLTHGPPHAAQAAAGVGEAGSCLGEVSCRPRP